APHLQTPSVSIGRPRNRPCPAARYPAIPPPDYTPGRPKGLPARRRPPGLRGPVFSITPRSHAPKPVDPLPPKLAVAEPVRPCPPTFQHAAHLMSERPPATRLQIRRRG